MTSVPGSEQHNNDQPRQLSLLSSDELARMQRLVRQPQEMRHRPARCLARARLEPKNLVKFWHEAALPELEGLESLTEGLEIDWEKLEESEALLKSGWSKLMSSG